MKRREFLQRVPALGIAPFLDANTGALPPVITAVSTSGTPKLPEMIQTPLRVGLIVIGGAACSMAPTLINRLPHSDKVIAIDTSRRSLIHAGGDVPILLGDGTGKPASPLSVRDLANAASEQIARSLAGLHLIFILVGLGGAAGSGVAPEVFRIADELDILALGVVILPFAFETADRKSIAREAFDQLKGIAPGLLPLDNEALAKLGGEAVTLKSILSQCNERFVEFYRGIVFPCTVPGLVGFDFDDLRHLFRHKGLSACATSFAEPPCSELDLVKQAIRSPSLGWHRLGQARGLLVHIEGAEPGNVLAIFSEIASHVASYCPDDADIFYSIIPRQDEQPNLRVTIII